MAIDNSLSFKTNFLLTFSKLPNVQYFVQDLQIPAMNLGVTQVNSPVLDVPTPGDKLTFDPLTISFLIDEHYKNYVEAADWMIEFRDPTTGKASNLGISDADIIILDNNKNPIIKVSFIDCFPTSLDGSIFDVSAEGDDPQVANLTLNYAYYTIKRINIA